MTIRLGLNEIAINGRPATLAEAKAALDELLLEMKRQTRRKPSELADASGAEPRVCIEHEKKFTT